MRPAHRRRYRLLHPRRNEATEAGTLTEFASRPTAMPKRSKFLLRFRLFPFDDS